MLRLIPLVALLVMPTIARSQISQPPSNPRRATGVGSTRAFLSGEGFGNSNALAQASFRMGVEDRLCVDLGIKRGPGALATSFFTFSREVTDDGQNRSIPLKVDYDKKATVKTDKFIFRSGCVTNGASVESSERSQIRVRVRQPGRGADLFFVKFPSERFAYTLNLFSLSNGALRSELVETLHQISDEPATVGQSDSAKMSGQG
jgi:hypothetical protein